MAKICIQVHSFNIPICATRAQNSLLKLGTAKFKIWDLVRRSKHNKSISTTSPGNHRAKKYFWQKTSHSYTPQTTYISRENEQGNAFQIDLFIVFRFKIFIKMKIILLETIIKMIRKLKLSYNKLKVYLPFHKHFQQQCMFFLPLTF